MIHTNEILVNEAMKIERAEALGAQPYEKTSERRGYATYVTQPKRPAIRFLFVESDLRHQLPSDSASRRTPTT